MTLIDPKGEQPYVAPAGRLQWLLWVCSFPLYLVGFLIVCVTGAPLAAWGAWMAEDPSTRR